MLPSKSYYRFKTGCIQYKKAKLKYKNIIAIRQKLHVVFAIVLSLSQVVPTQQMLVMILHIKILTMFYCLLTFQIVVYQEHYYLKTLIQECSCFIYVICVGLHILQCCPTHVVLCFCLFFFVLCTLCCQFLWIVYFDCLFGIL